MTEPAGRPVEAWQIPAALEGERIDRALALLTGLPRRQVSELIDAAQVVIGRRTVTSHSRRVHAGEQLGAVLPEAAADAGPVADESVEVPVVWSDDQVVVIDKPAGLVVHPGSGNRTGTLVHGLLARFPDLARLAGPAGQGISAGSGPRSGGEVSERDRPGIVHRLDKGTSGLLMVARTVEARQSLVTQLAARSVERRYAALVHGSLSSDEGVVDAPLGRSHRDPTRMAVLAAGREARTRYLVVARFDRPGPATLLECQLESGRTHQVRVHMAAIGHPVFGDDRYRTAPVPVARSPLLPGRSWLHARVLGFDHPTTGERLRFSSPLPGDLAHSIEVFHLVEGSRPPGWARG